jgi:hypothetical protein
MSRITGNEYVCLTNIWLMDIKGSCESACHTGKYRFISHEVDGPPNRYYYMRLKNEDAIERDHEKTFVLPTLLH